MRFAPVTLAAAVLVLGACAPTGVSTVGQKYPIYKTAYNGYALNDRDVFVIIQGGGYNMEQAAFQQTVIDGMQRSRGGSRNTNFTTTPRNNYNSDYKVVMLFNGPVTAQPDDLCARPEQFAGLKPVVNGSTQVLAAFCRYDAPLTGVTGTATGVTNPSDPRFASLIRATVTDLFPATDERPMRDSDGGNDGGGGIP